MASPSRGPTSAFYVFFGEEDFFLDRGIEMARRWPNREIRHFDASDKLDELTLVRELETPVLDGSERTIIVDEAQKLKETKHKALRSFVDDRASGDTSVVLVAIVRAEKLSDVWSHVGAKGKFSEHKKFKPWPDKFGKTEHQKWAESEAKRVGLGLEDGVSELIIQMTGDSLYRIQNELRKLYWLTGGGKVSKQQVMSIVAVTPTAEPKDVVEATFAKNVHGALNALSLLFKTMGDEASVPVTYGLMREAQKTITARHLLDKGASDEDIATTLGMNPWRCKTVFLPTVRKHSAESLVKCMRRLCALDQNVKGSSSSKRTLVELAVLSIAG